MNKVVLRATEVVAAICALGTAIDLLKYFVTKR